MQTDLQGRVSNETLPLTKGLLPLYEAIINSIDAIEERGQGPGRITIEIERDPSLLSDDEFHGNVVPDIDSFTVRDNGIGFTEKNYRSFQTLDTRAKADKGGKGIGRILWLKAFDHADISSRYLEDGKVWRREFTFCMTREGIEDHSKTEVAELSPTDVEPETTVELRGYRDQYQSHTRKRPDIIARNIVDHCLEFFILGDAPEIRLVDEDQEEEFDLNGMFRSDFETESQMRSFSVSGHEFELQNVFLQADGHTNHQLAFCAHNRVVTSLELGSHIAHLESTLRPDEEAVVYAGYISSPFLDERVGSSRTGFDVHRRGELPLDGTEVAWEEIQERAVGEVDDFLKPITQEARQRARERVREFVETRAPRYRPVLSRRSEQVEEIPGDVTEETLDLHLHRLLQDLKHDLRQKAQEQLEQESDDPESFEAFRSEREELYEQLQEVAKSELAEYVFQRSMMLDFYQKMLGRKDDGDFPLEDALHEIFFPKRSTSEDVEYEDHNLWILDERLAYHEYLASDVPFSGQNAPIEVKSGDRPDIVIFNRPMAFTEEDHNISSVVVVEFKRPERDDYRPGENPIDQVLDYVRQMREGKRRRSDGSTINLQENTPFYCYVVATMTPNLKDMAERRDFTIAPDGLGYFDYHEQYRAYMEVLSYRKVLDDAKKRNRVFFDKLQIPTH